MLVKSVFITGASSGLGYSAAIELSRNGFYVFAAARKVKGIFSGISNIEEICVDVTNEQSVKRAFESIESKKEKYPLWAIINNAGVCIPGPLELLNPTELQRQLDTSIMGSLFVTQYSLPYIHHSKGRIINVISGLGDISPPYLGAYSIAQFAKRALSDALRRELKNSGVSVIVVQPGKIHTPIWDKFSKLGKKIINKKDKRWEIYENSFSDFLSQNNAKDRLFTITADDFSQVIFTALTTPDPDIHYYVGEIEKEFSEKVKNSSVFEIDRWFDALVPTSEEFKNK